MSVGKAPNKYTNRWRTVCDVCRTRKRSVARGQHGVNTSLVVYEWRIMTRSLLIEEERLSISETPLAKPIVVYCSVIRTRSN